MRLTCWLMTALFGLSVAVQVNDPDPGVWMLGYAVPAALSLAGALGRLPLAAAGAGAVLYLVLALLWLPEVMGARAESFTSVAMDSLRDEEAREGLGLWIAAAWLVALAAWRFQGAAGDAAPPPA